MYYGIDDTGMEGRPHIVILGAGASRAAFPNGDKNGKKLPLMNNLVDVVDLRSLLEKAGIDPSQNFEAVYSAIYLAPKLKDIAVEIEDAVSAYFTSLVLPDYPTMYDHLVLSLRKKDVIATFNWDPFLFESCRRNRDVAAVPRVIFLHGCVSIGYCIRHERSQVGLWPGICRICGVDYQKFPLLFPVKEKGYANYPILKQSWDILRSYMAGAYMVTIFGYSAPVTDVEAISLLKEGWGDKEQRNLEQFEIIDTKDEDEIRRTWEEFIHTHHYQVEKDFYASWIAKFPRRTCEAMWNQVMETEFLPDNPFPKDLDFPALWEWYKPLVEAESQL